MIKTTRRSPETPDQKAARLHDAMERRLAAVGRLEAALPLVTGFAYELRQADIREWIALAHRWHPDGLERCADTAERWVREVPLEGQALIEQAARDEYDLFGPRRE